MYFLSTTFKAFTGLLLFLEQDDAFNTSHKGHMHIIIIIIVINIIVIVIIDIIIIESLSHLPGDFMSCS